MRASNQVEGLRIWSLGKEQVGILGVQQINAESKIRRLISRIQGNSQAKSQGQAPLESHQGGSTCWHKKPLESFVVKGDRPL